MIQQYDLAKWFAEGDDVDGLPLASNVKAESAEGSDDKFEAYLVGYNWAMYAGRTSEGSVVLFTGWHGYSNTTTNQIGQLRRGISDGTDNWRTSDLTPEVRSEVHAERENEESKRHYPGHEYPA